MLVTDYIKKYGNIKIEDKNQDWKIYIIPEQNFIGGMFKAKRGTPF